MISRRPFMAEMKQAMLLFVLNKKTKKEDLTNEYALEDGKLVCKPLELLE